MPFMCTMSFVNTSQIPGSSGARRAHGAWQGGRDLREVWDESGLLGGRNLQCEQKWFKVNVVGSGFTTTSHIPLRCVVTRHNLGCGTYTKNTLTKVIAPISDIIGRYKCCTLSTKLKVSLFHVKGRYTHALNCIFPQGTLWRLWSQEMPWALGSVQLLSKPFFWRVWGPEWNLVYEWQGPDGIPSKYILRPLCQCNWWALLFVGPDRSSSCYYAQVETHLPSAHASGPQYSLKTATTGSMQFRATHATNKQ